MTDIRELLDDIEKRADEATPGDWHVHDDNEGTDYFPLWVVANDEFYNPTGGDEDMWQAVHMYVETGCKADAEFVAAARTDVPRLVAALRAVLQVCDKEGQYAGVHPYSIHEAITYALEGKS